MKFTRSSIPNLVLNYSYHSLDSFALVTHQRNCEAIFLERLAGPHASTATGADMDLQKKRRNAEDMIMVQISKSSASILEFVLGFDVLKPSYFRNYSDPLLPQ